MRGRFGPLTYATPQSRRKSKSFLYGKIIKATGPNIHEVLFQDGSKQICESCKLKIAHPEDIPPTLRPSNSVSDGNESDIDPDAIDNDERIEAAREGEDDEESLPEDPPESQDTVDTVDSSMSNVSEGMSNVSEGSTTTNDTEDTAELSYHEKLALARQKIKEVTGDTLETTNNNQSILWTVIEDHLCATTERSTDKIGLKPEVLEEVTEDPTMIASEIFLRLMFGNNMTQSIAKMNRSIQIFNETHSRTNISLFSTSEFLRGIALLIGSVCFSANGNQLWKKECDEDSDDWVSVEHSAEFQKWMSKCRFKEFRSFLPTIYADEARKETDPWWRFIDGVEQFNLNRLTHLVSSNHISMDELMSAWRPRTTKTGGLPNITFILRKPEPLGTEFKCAGCSAAKFMMFLEIQRGKEAMKLQRYNRELGATAACTLRLSEER